MRPDTDSPSLRGQRARHHAAAGVPQPGKHVVVLVRLGEHGGGGVA